MRSFITFTITALGMINLGNAAPGPGSLSKRTGGFYVTCDQVTLDNWTLTANCQNVDKDVKTTSLNLKRCLVDGGSGYLKCAPKG